VPRVDPEVIQRLQARIPSLVIKSVGGVLPFKAEGSLGGLFFTFRYQYGNATLCVGADTRMAPLYEAPRWWYGPRHGQRLDGPEFEQLMLLLVPELERAKRYWEFDGVPIRRPAGARSGLWYPYGAFAHTPQEALASIVAYPQHIKLTGRRAPTPEEWAAEVAARQINPQTKTIDLRAWPDPEPQFIVLPA
jgi:hypothetical protein